MSIDFIIYPLIKIQVFLIFRIPRAFFEVGSYFLHFFKQSAGHLMLDLILTFLATKATNAFGIYLHYGSEFVIALTLHLV